MEATLLISVRWHDGRYHGSGHWPPSPARLFQALVAGAAKDGLSGDAEPGATGSETLGPPVIQAPVAKRGQLFRTFVPNNDLDAKGW